MLKKIALAVMLILPMGVFAQTFKFGHVSSQEVIMAMPDYAKAVSDLQALEKTHMDEMQRTQEEFNKTYQQFQEAMSGENPLPQNIAERRQKELQDMAQRAEQYQQDAAQDIQQKQQEFMAPIYKKVDDAIKAVGQEDGYTFIFDTARTAIPYINNAQATDVTSKVKTKLGIAG